MVKRDESTDDAAGVAVVVDDVDDDDDNGASIGGNKIFCSVSSKSVSIDRNSISSN